MNRATTVDPQPPGLAVFRARLPYIDRRALSQAWYAALHLTDVPAAAVRRLQPKGFGSTCGARDTRTDTKDAAPAARGAAAIRRSAARAAGRPTAAPETAPVAIRRKPVVPASLARRLPSLRTHFSLAVGGARVQFLVRREHARLCVIAVCRASEAATVRQALADVQRMMLARGDAFEMQVRVCAQEFRA